MVDLVELPLHPAPVFSPITHRLGLRRPFLRLLSGGRLRDATRSRQHHHAAGARGGVEMLQAGDNPLLLGRVQRGGDGGEEGGTRVGGAEDFARVAKGGGGGSGGGGVDSLRMGTEGMRKARKSAGMVENLRRRRRDGIAVVELGIGTADTRVRVARFGADCGPAVLPLLQKYLQSRGMEFGYIWVP